MTHPLVTAITPIHDLRFLQNALDNFNRQDYPNKELVFILDHFLRESSGNIHYVVSTEDKTVGAKRNRVGKD